MDYIRPTQPSHPLLSARPFIVAFLLAATFVGYGQTFPPNDQAVPYYSVDITATRTVTFQTDQSRASGCSRKETEQENSSLSVQVSLHSDKVAVTKQKGYFALSLTSNAPYKGGQPLEGSATLEYLTSSTHVDGCGCDVTQTSGTGNARTNLNNMHIGFTWNKDSKQGDFSLGFGYEDAAGNGTQKQKDCQGKTTSESLKKIMTPLLQQMGGAFGQFTAANHSIYQNLNLPQQVLNQMNKVKDVSGNGGLCTITETKTGYEIGYNNSVTNDVRSPDDSWQGTKTATINTQVHISIGGKPKYYDAILETVSVNNAKADYATWIPQGPTLGSQSGVGGQPGAGNQAGIHGMQGNSIGFRVYLVDRDHPDQVATDIKYDVEYKLLPGTSHEPGYCLNYPLQNAGNEIDLKFDPIMQHISWLKSYSDTMVSSKDYHGDQFTATLTSYDYGSYGTLQATVKFETLPDQYAHFKNDKKIEIPLPKDDNHNHIADYWEETAGILSKNYPADWDDEQQSGNDNNGDGLTLYEEYRGVIAKGKIKRLSPDKKDIIIGNTSSDNLDAAIGYFQRGTGNSISPVELVAGKELPTDEAIVNKNSSAYKKGDQYGIILKREPISADKGDAVLGQVMVKDGIPPNLPPGSHIPTEPTARNPKEVNHLAINTAAVVGAAQFPYAFAHELAHCLNVQHHGNAPSVQLSTMDHYAVDGQFVDEDNKPVSAAFLQAFKTHVYQGVPPPVYAATPGSQASGNVRCIMCYNQDYEYSFPKGQRSTILINCNLQYPNGTIFCTDKAGTGRNDKDQKPCSVFGDATDGGNCVGQFQVKSY